MGKYIVDTVVDKGKIYYMVKDDSMSIVRECTRYLKHKTNQNRSPNTVRRLAYTLCYYLDYLDVNGVNINTVLQMGYTSQYAHFSQFLTWLSEGRHTNKEKTANNNTCNSYLKAVLGFVNFLCHDENIGKIRVLEKRHIGYSNTVGIKFGRNTYMFPGLLPPEESKGQKLDKDNILKLLKAAANNRTKLVILLLAETGLRIGELLGIKYAIDINYDTHDIRVMYREDNPNRARAKNAEYRTVRMSDDTFDFLCIYISQNKELLANSEYLFCVGYGPTKGEPLTVNAVYSEFRLLKKKTGIKATPHMLRHYFADERRRAGWEINKISAALGHKHIATTERYLHVSDDELEEAMTNYYASQGGICSIKKLL